MKQLVLFIAMIFSFLFAVLCVIVGFGALFEGKIMFALYVFIGFPMSLALAIVFQYVSAQVGAIEEAKEKKG